MGFGEEQLLHETINEQFFLSPCLSEIPIKMTQMLSQQRATPEDTVSITCRPSTVDRDIEDFSLVIGDSSVNFSAHGSPTYRNWNRLKDATVSFDRDRQAIRGSFRPQPRLKGHCPRKKIIVNLLSNILAKHTKFCQVLYRNLVSAY